MIAARYLATSVLAWLRPEEAASVEAALDAELPDPELPDPELTGAELPDPDCAVDVAALDVELLNAELDGVELPDPAGAVDVLDPHAATTIATATALTTCTTDRARRGRVLSWFWDVTADVACPVIVESLSR